METPTMTMTISTSPAPLNVPHIISLLFKDKDKPLTHQPHSEKEIIGALSTYRDEDILPYLQQLAHLVVISELPEVVNMVLQRCKMSMHFALRTFFLLQASVEDDIPDLVHKANTLWKECEFAAIRSSFPPTSSRVQLHSQGLSIKDIKHRKLKVDKDLEGPMDSSSDLQRIVYEYFYSELHLVNSLYNISAALMTIPQETPKLKESRDHALKLLLRQLSVQLVREASLELPLSAGCTLVNIVHNESVCLSSRNRVPYLMIVEVLGSQAQNGRNAQENGNDDNTNANGLSNSVESYFYTTEPNNHDVPREDGEDELGYNPDEDLLGDGWVILPEKRKKRNVYLAQAFPELWCEKEDRIRSVSKHGTNPNWKLMAVIVKSGDDLRQEQLASQLIGFIHSWFQKEKLPLWLRPYAVIATSSTTGLIECVTDAISIDSLKKRIPTIPSLADYYICAYGHRTSVNYVTAQTNFVESLAAYSIICYLLQIKDRHNGNILVDAEGHIIHIDFGFMLGCSPGNLGFELAPFKLTTEFIQVMGGVDSDMFKYFKTLLLCGFLEVRRHADELVLMVEVMEVYSRMACFPKKGVAAALRERLKLDLSEEGCMAFIDILVNDSIRSWTTGSYDSYQYYTNGIL